MSNLTEVFLVLAVMAAGIATIKWRGAYSLANYWEESYRNMWARKDEFTDWLTADSKEVAQERQRTNKYKKQAKRLRRELHVYREKFGNIHNRQTAENLANAMRNTTEKV